MATQSQIIGVSVNDQSTSHNVVRAGQRDLGIANVHLQAKYSNLIAVHL